MSALFTAKRSIARGVGRLSRASGRGGGTTLPGRLLVRMAPDAIERLASSLDRGSIVVSSTNGKTTTAGMIAGILEAAGRRPGHNRAGSEKHLGGAAGPLRETRKEGAFRARGGRAPPGPPHPPPPPPLLGDPLPP